MFSDFFKKEVRRKKIVGTENFERKNSSFFDQIIFAAPKEIHFFIFIHNFETNTVGPRYM